MSKWDDVNKKQNRNISNSLRYLLLSLLFPVILTACGGGDVPATASGSSGGTSGGGGSINPAPVNLTMSAMTFGVSPLSAFGTTSVSVTINNNGAVYTTPVNVNFTSTCGSSGKATLTPIVTTVNGVATASYLDNGCAGNDIVQAAVTSGPSNSNTLTVIAPETGSLQFVSASPTSIALKGTGGSGRSETSRITFKVLDSSSQPIGSKTVNFSLTTTVGGLTLSTPSAISDPTTGHVVVDVHAGTISTAIRVTASTTTNAGALLTTQSDQLFVSTGLADQDSFSLSATVWNPEGWGYDGETSTFTVMVADHFNNPVPDGTAIYFTTEGGRINPSCNTVGGSCSVTWTSQNPRPADGDGVGLNDRTAMVTVTATTIGEESFSDVNGDGYFDNSDFATFAANPSLDLPEAWRDDNLDGDRDVTEPFTDFNTDYIYNAANTIYNGILCTDAGVLAGVCTKNLLSVRTSMPIVMSGSLAVTSFFDDAVPPNPIQVICLRDAGLSADTTPADGCPDKAGTSVVPAPVPPASCTDVANFNVIVQDLNGNSMPNGTTITATSSLGQMLGTSSYTIDNRLGPFTARFSIQEACGGVPQAELELKVTTPNGHQTITTFKILDDG